MKLSWHKTAMSLLAASTLAMGSNVANATEEV
jgi:hypothetical protein